jgi:hypothetical protein
MDLVAVAATLPRHAVYTTRRRSASADQATVLVFREPPARPVGVPARPSPGSGRPSLFGRVPDIDVGFDEDDNPDRYEQVA